ncbi:MAG TPA: hypothetical protein VLQ79_05615, partial [Myxococcaceae bacterium]|nr:hypothetical protein [Myxococcaceae bacterium]
SDVGAFLRRMFPEEAGVAEPIGDTGSIPISLSVSAPAQQGIGEAVPEGEPSGARATERVEPAPAETPDTELLTAARRAPWRRVGAALAVLAIAGATAVTVRSGSQRLRAWRERPSVPGSTEASTSGHPALAAVVEAPVEPGPAEAPGQRSTTEPAAIAAGPAELRDVMAGSRGRGAASTPGNVRVALLIRAKPWARLRIDGRRAGDVQGSRTVRLTAGRHVLELTGPDGVPTAYPVQLLQGRPETLEHPPLDR